MNYEEYGLQPLTNEEHSKYLNKYPNGNNFHFIDGYRPSKDDKVELFGQTYRWINSDKVILSIICTSNPAQKKYRRFQNELTEPQFQGGFLQLMQDEQRYFLMKDIDKFIARVWEDAKLFKSVIDIDEGVYYDNDTPNSDMAYEYGT